MDEVSDLVSMELTSKVSVFGKNKFGQLVVSGCLPSSDTKTQLQTMILMCDACREQVIALSLLISAFFFLIFFS